MRPVNRTTRLTVAIARAAHVGEVFDQFGNLEDGFVLYDTVTQDQQRDLIAAIDATREPLSRLTSTVLGIS